MNGKLLFGDLHNHNAIGFGDGTFERSLEFARNNQLDFWALTPHSHFPDLSKSTPASLRRKYAAGFAKVTEVWPELQKKVLQTNAPGEFTVFLGYERHSMKDGDYHLIYPDDDGPLMRAATLAELQAHAKKHNALLIPHHIFYSAKNDVCGIKWDLLDSTVSPVVEICSEHGCSERDRGPRLGLRHSAGGCATESTAQHGLARGLRFGFVAGSDDQWACPGTYDEGLMAVWAEENTRQAIFQALRQRRTYALTGDRIRLRFELNGQPMGSVISGPTKRVFRVEVEGWDEIDRIEIIKNNRVVHRVHPVDRTSDNLPANWPERVRLMIQYGWGQYGEWVETGIYQWDVLVSLSDGEITRCVPCFRHGPFDEERVDRVSKEGHNAYRLTGLTSRKDVLNDDATKGIWLEISAPPGARLEVEGTLPGRCVFQKTLAELSQANHLAFAGSFPSPSILVHRPTEPATFTAEFEWTDEGPVGAEQDWYYLRVTQSNGQMAWSSPIWIES